MVSFFIEAVYITMDVHNDGVLHGNVPVILDFFHCLGFCTSVFSGTGFVSVIRYKCSYPVDHLLIPGLSESLKLVANFIHEDGNRG